MNARRADRFIVQVAVLGSLRGGEATWRSLTKHVLVPNSADLVLMLSEGKSAGGSPKAARTILHERAVRVWTVPERSDDAWAEAVDEIVPPLRHRALPLSPALRKRLLTAAVLASCRAQGRQLHAKNATAWRSELGSFRVREEEWMCAPRPLALPLRAPTSQLAPGDAASIAPPSAPDLPRAT